MWNIVRRDRSFRGQGHLTCGGGRAFVPPDDNVVSRWTLQLLGLALWSSASISVCPLFLERKKRSTSVCNSANQVCLLGFRNRFPPKIPQIYWSVLNSGKKFSNVFFQCFIRKCMFMDGNMLIEIMYINQSQSLVTKCISNMIKTPFVSNGYYYVSTKSI